MVCKEIMNPWLQGQIITDVIEDNEEYDRHNHGIDHKMHDVKYAVNIKTSLPIEDK